MHCTTSRTSRRARRRPAPRPNGRRRARCAPSSRCPSQISTRPSTWPRRDRQRRRRGATTRSRQRTTGRDDGRSARRGDERERPAPVRKLDLRVAGRSDRLDDAIPPSPHASSRCEVGVSLLARRAAEDRRVDEVAAPPVGGDLRPARVVGVSGLDADHARHTCRAGRSTCASTRPPAIDAVARRRCRGRTARASRPGASVVTSAAVEYAPGASRPSGRTKCVCARPSAIAFAFIRLRERVEVRRGAERERDSGVVRRLDQRAPIRSRTVSCSPARRSMLSWPTRPHAGRP